MTNRNYGKLRDDARIIYAPSEVKVGNTYYPAPTAEQYAACGYLPIDSTKPEKDGAYFISTEYGDLVDGRIVRRYDEHPIPAPEPPVVRYSKLKLIVASKAAGKWEAFKAFISSSMPSAVQSFATIEVKSASSERQYCGRTHAIITPISAFMSASNASPKPSAFSALYIFQPLYLITGGGGATIGRSS